MRKYKIAEAVVEIEYPECFIQEEFQPFECSMDNITELHWKLKSGYPQKPDYIQWKNFGNFRITCDESTVYVQYSSKEEYLIKFTTYQNDYKDVTYYIGNNDISTMNKTEIESLGRYLYYFHREAFLLAMLFQNAIAIHSATIIYENRGYVFSGPSGTGKSTHTNLWTQLYHTEILDGDIILCKKEEDGIWLYGIPWHGTSGLYQNRKVLLGGIIFLEQSKINEAEKLNEVESYKRIIARNFSPTWFPQLNKKVTDMISEIIKNEVPIFLLRCRPDKNAVNIIKEAIDQRK